MMVALARGLGILWLGGIAWAADGRFDISEHGAVADGSTVNTAAIQTAIDACAEAGGGTVVVPEGTFLSGALFFAPGVNLHLEEGSVLKGTTRLSDYRLVQTRWEGEERIWVSALVNVFGGEGFVLDGVGTIDGSGDVWHRDRGRQENPGLELPERVGPAGDGPPPLGPEGGLEAAPESPAHDLVATRLPGYARPRLVAIQNCTNVQVREITLRNQSSWGLFVLYSKDVRIEELTIRSEHYIPSSDGIDIDSCDGVEIRGVDIDVNDDCISIKSGKDHDGRRVGRPAENIRIHDCVFRYGHGGVAMGSEMSGGIRRVTVEDCEFLEGNWAPIRFKSQPSRGGVVEDITFRNLSLKNIGQAFEFNMAWRMRGVVRPPADPLGVVRNIRIENVQGTVERVGTMSGLADSPIRDVVFRDCEIRASESGFRLRHVEDIDLEGLDVTVPEGVEAVVRE